MPALRQTHIVLTVLFLVGCKDPEDHRMEVSSGTLVCSGKGEAGSPSCEVRALVSTNRPYHVLGFVTAHVDGQMVYRGVVPLDDKRGEFRTRLSGSIEAVEVRAEGFAAWPVGKPMSVGRVWTSCPPRGPGPPRGCVVHGEVKYAEQERGFLVVEAIAGGKALAWGLAPVQDGNGSFEIELTGGVPPDLRVETAGLVVLLRQKASVQITR